MRIKNLSLKFAACFAIFLLFLSGFLSESFADNSNSTVDDQGNYANPSLGIKFHVPPGWLVQEPKNTQPGAPDIAVVAPYSSGFTPYISVGVEKTNGTSLNDYLNNKKSQILQQSKNDNISFLSVKDGMVDGNNAKILVLTENFPIEGKDIKLKFNEGLILVGDKFYTITYANEEKNYDTDLSNYEDLLNSLHFSNQQNFIFNYTWYIISGIAIAGIIGTATLLKKRKH